MTVQEAYLELIQQTQLLLLQQIPIRKPPLRTPNTPLPAPEPISKPPLSKIEATQTPSPKTEVQTTSTLKKAVEEQPKQLQARPKESLEEKDLGDIKELLQQHCPAVKLLPTPLPFPAVLLLYENETPEEKKLLENIVTALQKRKISAELKSASQSDASWWQTSALKCVLASRQLILNNRALHAHAKRDEKGVLFFGLAPVFVIPDLGLLLREPERRAEIWNRLLEVLKT